MSKVLGVMTSDLHLSQNAWSSYASLYGDAEWALEQIVDYCNKHEVSWLILAGDVIDKPINSSAPIAALAAHLSKLQCPLFYIQGQHEMAKPTWLSCIAPEAIHLNDRLVGLRGVGPVYGLDYRKGSAALSEALKTIPANTRMLVAHQVWEEFMGGITVCDGSLCDASTYLREAGAKYILTGDLHKHVDKVITNGTRVLSPGATHMRKIDEPSQHKFFAWTDESSPIHSIELRSRPVYRFSILSENDLEKAAAIIKLNLPKTYLESADMPAHIAKPLIHVRYDVGVPGVLMKIKDAVNERAFIFDAPIRVETNRITVSRQKAANIRNLGLVGCLDLAIEDKDSLLYKDAYKLLTAVDKKQALEQMKQE